MASVPPTRKPADGETRSQAMQDKALEEALIESFPASDPPSMTSPIRGITGDDEVVNKPPPAEHGSGPAGGKSKAG